MTYPTVPGRVPAHDPDLIHLSTHSSFTTNASATPGLPPRVLLRTTRLELRWIDGVVALRFNAQDVDVAPRVRNSMRRPAR